MRKADAHGWLKGPKVLIPRYFRYFGATGLEVSVE